MAYRIINKPQDIVLSSMLSALRISADGEWAHVTVTGPDGPLLENRYFPFKGSLSLNDLNEPMEEYMRRAGVAEAPFSITVGREESVDDSASFRLLYCERVPPAGTPDMGTFLRENFLTTLERRRLAPQDTLLLSLRAFEGEDTTATVDYYYRIEGSDDILQGSMQPDGGGTSAADGIKTMALPLETVAAHAAERLKLKPYQVRLLNFTICVGSRIISCFVDPSLAGGRTFVFRNCFNVPERVTLAAVTTRKAAVDRSLASVGGRARFYDQKATFSHEVQTGGLTSDEAAWIDQLLISHSVMLLLRSPFGAEQLAPVLVTDSTCEIQDGDEALNTVKFTWRFDRNRPCMALPHGGGIFTYQYDNSFV